MAIPFDVIGVGVVLVIVFAIVIYAGKSAGISAIFALPLTAYLYNYLPYREYILSFAKNTTEAEVGKGVVATVLFLLIYVVLRKAISVVFTWSAIGKVFEAGIISVIFTGFLAILLAELIDPTLVINFLPALSRIISIPNILFYWPAGSFLILLFILR